MRAPVGRLRKKPVVFYLILPPGAAHFHSVLHLAGNLSGVNVFYQWTEECIVSLMIESMPADPRLTRRYYIEETRFRRFLVSLVRVLFPLAAQFTVNGVENLPAQGALVLVANHLTNFDVFPVQLALPRPVYFMAKAELHENRIFDALLRQLGSFPVQRGAKDAWAMSHARKVLEQGQVLGIFPEGTRSRDHSLRTAKTGAARLALSVNCPLMPLALTGTQNIFQQGWNRTAVHVEVGKPLFPGANDSPLALTDALMFAIAEMLPYKLRGAYAEHPRGF
jgi:1-acyl-sn-glycerol-3-phosphate acyltransferase